MARGRVETCRWEELYKNILVIQTLNKLRLTIFYLYILRTDMWCAEYGKNWTIVRTQGDRRESYRMAVDKP